MLDKNKKICLVVKADAYFLGAKKIVQNTNDLVDYFAVSSAEEFLKIKKQAKKPVLILSPVFKNLKIIIQAGAELTVSNFESFEKIILVAKKYENLKIKIHIAANTGMNRFGFKETNEIKILFKICKMYKNIEIIGVFSHYFFANCEKYAKIQNNKFKKIELFLKNEFNFSGIFHLSATDGIFFENHFQMVRIGMGAYTDKSYQTITLKSKILDIQNLRKNETAGYNGVFVATKRTKIAIVGIGYADGISRKIAGRGFVLVGDNFCKIVAVCMDSILVDVTGVNSKVQDDVVLIGKSFDKQIFVCDVASWCDTIGYEILAKLKGRIKRKYIGETNANYNREIQSKKT